MPINKTKYTYYEAQGFVEALIAVMITGIASVALMTIAAKTISDVVRNEKLDQLTQEAVKGNNMLDYIIEEWNFGSRTLGSAFLQNGTTFTQNTGRCYALDGEIDAPVITPLPGCQYDYTPEFTGIRPIGCLSDWDSVKIDSYDSEGFGEGMFRLMCITNSSGSDGYVMLAKIYTGFQSCSDEPGTVRELLSVDNACSIYEYISVYTVEP